MLQQLALLVKHCPVHGQLLSLPVNRTTRTRSRLLIMRFIEGLLEDAYVTVVLVGRLMRVMRHASSFIRT